MNDSAANSDGDGLSSISGAKLLHDVLEMNLHRFFRYEQQIREEYGWVDRVIFAAKRAEILRRFLARKRIYQTEWYHNHLEAQARANLAASIKQLMLQVPPV